MCTVYPQVVAEALALSSPLASASPTPIPRCWPRSTLGVPVVDMGWGGETPLAPSLRPSRPDIQCPQGDQPCWPAQLPPFPACGGRVGSQTRWSVRASPGREGPQLLRDFWAWLRVVLPRGLASLAPGTGGDTGREGRWQPGPRASRTLPRGGRVHPGLPGWIWGPREASGWEVAGEAGDRSGRGWPCHPA